MFKSKQEVLKKFAEIFPDLPRYRDYQGHPDCELEYRARKVKEEYNEWMRAEVGTPHEVEEALDTMQSLVTWVRTCVPQEILEQGYERFIEKHRRRYIEDVTANLYPPVIPVQEEEVSE